MDMERTHSRGRVPLRPVRSRGAAALAPLAFALAAVTGAFAADSTRIDTTRTDSAVVTTPTPSPPAAPDSSLTGGVVAAPRGEVLPAVSNPFSAGEKLKFVVQYGFIKAGNAYLEIPEVKQFEGRPVYTLVARAESNSFFRRFYKVRNRIESFWDTSGRYSLRYTENRREGGHRAHNEITFDYRNQQAVYHDGRTFPIPPGVQDALSSFYYTRTQALPMGGSVFFDYHASRKSQPLEVKVLGREKVETPAGKFQCVAIEPVLKAGGIFKNKGRLVIWLTDDERRMPVMMRSKVAVGSISVLLVEAKSG
jgi:hypothetical protein